MSAVSQFMEALEQATHPERPPETPKTSAFLENNFCLDQENKAAPESSLGPPDHAYTDSLSSTGGLHHCSAMRDASVDQKATADAHFHGSQQTLQMSSRTTVGFYQQSHETEILPAQMKTMSGPSAGEPPTRPQLPARDSLDELFSDAESDQDNMLDDDPSYEDEPNSDHIKEAWASDGTLFTTAASAQPYDPTAPMQFYEDTIAPDFGSPQVSPETPLYLQRQPARTGPHSDAYDPELHSALSEANQNAHFSDKAFRKALREVEPSLSKQQQYYAWRNAYQNADDKRTDCNTDDVEFEEKAAPILDQNPPYQLGMKPVGYMDGVPIFADIDAAQSMEEIDDRAEQINSWEGDPANGDVSWEEVYQRQRNDSSDPIADPEGVRSFNPFPPHHNLPAATTPRADMVTRERMLESSFSEALQALEKDNAQRIARESEVDEAHLQRLRTLSRPREWVLENSDARDDDEDGKRQQAQSPRRAVVGSKGSLEPQATSPTEAQDGTASPSKMNHDESFATALESPEKQRSGSETMSTIQANMAEYARQQHAHVHESDEEVEPPTPRSQIPGLEHLNRPSPPLRHETPAQPSTPPSSTSLAHFNANIRKSIEPETPTHLLHRDCTPAFEDRSATPSPRSLPNADGDVDVDRNTDVEMEETPTPANYHHPSGTHISTKPTLPLPTSSPDPISSPNQSKLHPPRASIPANTTATTNRARSRSRSRPCSPTKPTATQASTSHPSSSALKPTKERHPDRTTIPGRRKSAVQGSGVKIEKPNKPTAKSRTPSRKVATSSIKRFAAAAATTASGKNNNGAVGVSAGSVTTVNVVGSTTTTAGSTTKVKEAVERIEAGMLRKDQGRVRQKGTPPMRRSRRLMERKRETPEPEPGPGPGTLSPEQG